MNKQKLIDIVDLMSNNEKYVGNEYECYNEPYRYLQTIKERLIERKETDKVFNNNFILSCELENTALWYMGNIADKEEIQLTDLIDLNSKIINLVINYELLENKILSFYKYDLETTKILTMDLYISSIARVQLDYEGIAKDNPECNFTENDLIVVAEFYMTTAHPLYNKENPEDTYAGRDTYLLETKDELENISY